MGPSEAVPYMCLADVSFVSGARHAGAPLFRLGDGVRIEAAPDVSAPSGPVLAVAVGTVVPFPESGMLDAAWTGFRYDARTGSDAFWTVPLDGQSPVRLVGAERAWFRSDGRAYLVGARPFPAITVADEPA